MLAAAVRGALRFPDHPPRGLVLSAASLLTWLITRALNELGWMLNLVTMRLLAFLLPQLFMLWLFLGQASRAPSWTTIFSFAEGMLFFSILVGLKWLRRREPTADLEVFIRKQLEDCMNGTW